MRVLGHVCVRHRVHLVSSRKSHSPGQDEVCLTVQMEESKVLLGQRVLEGFKFIKFNLITHLLMIHTIVPVNRLDNPFDLCLTGKS